MSILSAIVRGLEYILFFYFASSALYVFVFALSSLLRRKKPKDHADTHRRIAVLVPGYKEDNVIVDTAKQALFQDYPRDKYTVVIIADSFREDTLEKLRNLPIRLVEVSFEKSTKSKALNAAMAEIGDDYDIALVLDADNVMEKPFLKKINIAFDSGFNVVQGHRVAKNMNTNMAMLDAVSEEINNSIFRKGHRVLGLSSALIGSGMAFGYAFFKTTMANIDAVGGFDKELEMKLLRGRQKIEYLENAYVLDEKVQKTEVFANQRRRWLSAQLVYLRRYFFSGLFHLFFRGNIDFFDKVYQMIAPPRVLLLGLTFILALTSLTFSFFIQIQLIEPVYWGVTFVTTVLGLMLAVPAKLWDRKLLEAVISLPASFIVMLLSLFKLRGANKKFIHTQHGTDDN